MDTLELEAYLTLSSGLKAKIIATHMVGKSVAFVAVYDTMHLPYLTGLYTPPDQIARGSVWCDTPEDALAVYMSIVAQKETVSDQPART